MKRENRDGWEDILKESKMYISGLKDMKGNPIVQGRRRTGYVGFLACIDSVSKIFDDLVGCDNAPMRYLLTYKLSQDHV